MSQDTSNRAWYALLTRSNFEKTVKAELESKVVENYCPGLDDLAPLKLGSPKPLFPGYLFVRMDPNTDERLTVLKSRGAVRLLGTGNEIQPIPDEQIDSLRKALSSARAMTLHRFTQRGTWMRVMGGPLAGVEGRLLRQKNHTRLILSVDLLARSIAVEVDSDEIEVVDTKSATLARR
jgi:transcription antitermination factor NusG